MVETLIIHLIYLSVRFFNSCRRLPETKRHSCLFLHWSGSKFLVVMAACIPSIHVFLGCPLYLLSHCIQSIIKFGILSSGIPLTWPYYCNLFCSIISMMSSFPFTPIIPQNMIIDIIQGAAEIVKHCKILVTCLSARVSRSAGICT